MEIIKRGVAPSDWKYEGRCNSCGTEVRFKRSEAEFVPDQREGNFLRVKCPVCNGDINVDCYQRGGHQCH